MCVRLERPSRGRRRASTATAVYVHLDLDVLDPDIFPAQFPVAGRAVRHGLRLLLDEVAQAADVIVGVEVTAFEAPEDSDETPRLAELVADAIEPLLPVED